MLHLAQTCDADRRTTKKLEKTGLVADYLKSRSTDEAAVVRSLSFGTALSRLGRNHAAGRRTLLWRSSRNFPERPKPN